MLQTGKQLQKYVDRHAVGQEGDLGSKVCDQPVEQDRVAGYYERSQDVIDGQGFPKLS